jgi:DNA-binding winged helix-turn-helix (wHTH) protein
MRYCFGAYTLDLQHFELHCAAEVIPLRRKSFDLIVYLLTHRDRVVARQELLDALWPDQIVSECLLEGFNLQVSHFRCP